MIVAHNSFISHAESIGANIDCITVPETPVQPVEFLWISPASVHTPFLEKYQQKYHRFVGISADIINTQDNKKACKH